MHAAIFIAISLVLGVICLTYLRRFDRHEAESFGRMLAVMCGGGAWAMLTAWVLYRLMAQAGLHAARTALGAMLVVGPVEEAAKLMALLSCYPLIRRHLDEPTDGLIYMACVALGFSLIENVAYALTSPSGGVLLVVRLAICTPVHIAFSLLMGLALYHFTVTRRHRGFLPLAWLSASVLHGIYDVLLLNRYTALVVPVVLWLAWWWTLRLLAYTDAVSPFRESLGAYLGDFSAAGVEDAPACLDCGSTAPKPTIRRDGIVVRRCEDCGSYQTTWRSLKRIFRLFASVYSRPWRYYRSRRKTGRRWSTLYRANRIDRATDRVAFNLGDLEKALQDLSDEIAAQTERAWWFPKRWRREPALSARRASAESGEYPAE